VRSRTRRKSGRPENSAKPSINSFNFFLQYFQLVSGQFFENSSAVANIRPIELRQTLDESSGDEFEISKSKLANHRGALSIPDHACREQILDAAPMRLRSGISDGAAPDRLESGHREK